MIKRGVIYSGIGLRAGHSNASLHSHPKVAIYVYASLLCDMYIDMNGRHFACDKDVIQTILTI